MSYKKRFAGVNTTGSMSPISGANSNKGAWNGSPGQNGSETGGWNNDQFGYKNYASRLPEVYVGHPNRIERYNQYEMMDVDAEINACLDIIAEFCTQTNEHNKTPFNLEFSEDPTPHEVELLKKQLQQWCKLNEFDTRAFKIFRNTIKYGDQAFIRDPENFKLYWVDMTKVIKVIVNESEGKLPEQYVIKDINVNLQNLSVAQKNNTDFAANPATGSGGTGGGSVSGGYTVPNTATTNGRFTLGIQESAIDAKHVVHLSLTEGLDRFWPFGQSILENIFKVYKQKELLEDAVLIYRVQRAPERRIFKIDVGNMPSHMAMAFVERIKNEIHQRRIPSVHGGSSILDATYNPMCLDMTTKVPLLDGRTLSLTDLVTEYESGKQNWVYSCDHVTGEIKPGNITWAGVTRRDAQVIKLTFDNGKTLICTPDHKIPVLSRGFVEAQDLTVTDSLIAFNTQEKPISSGNQYKDRTYVQVYDHFKKKWVYVHRMVGEFFRNLNEHNTFTYLEENLTEPHTLIHHSDFDRYNNDPSNLIYMGKQDHLKYHSNNKMEYWSSITDEESDRIRSKISETLKLNWKNLSDGDKAEALVRFKLVQEKAIWARKNDPVLKASYSSKASLNRKQYLKDHPEFLVTLRENTEHRVKFRNQPLEFTQDILGKVVSTIKGKTTNRLTAIELCNSNKELLDMFIQANPFVRENHHHTLSKIDFTKWGYKKMDGLIKWAGYKNWKTFVHNLDTYNHKIVSIEWLTDHIDTGCITIDGDEKYHTHHTFAIESGIFVKNSMNEDYFFPVTADGRGSDVTTLAGGQNLGEIDDLRYFNNRLARGLRIPSSYLPTGPDDSERILGDGKVGTAMIQEFRFNQYCERLQKYISQKLDEEFKLFLRWRGLNIDSGLFTLKFNEPQNFASYRQSELDTSRVNTFSTVEAYPYISKRFALERFLGLTEEEIVKNEKLWREENNKDEDINPQGSDLRSIGVSVGDMETDTQTADDMDNPEGEMPGTEIAGAVASPTAGAPAPGGAPGGVGM